LNNLSQFWQELKRRKVVRVVSVYAAAAFVILELVSIIVEPLKLPEWLLPVVIVLLCIGFIIAIILSWIFDVTPDGIERTKHSKELPKGDKPLVPNSWKIATYISGVIIIGLLILNIFDGKKRVSIDESLEKSIAVLPFSYLSGEPDKQYLADGVMGEIQLNLSKIKDLHVLDRTSVEQFRETEKTATEICQELGVAFLLEGEFHQEGDQVRLTVGLIESGREGNIWGEKYDRSWRDILEVQSEVAKLVASELQAIITPEEKQLIEKRQTSNLTAYDFYLRAQEEFSNYNLSVYVAATRISGDSKESIEGAKDLFEKALEYDSTYAQAYVGLAKIYMKKNFWEEYLQEKFMDSVQVLANIALSYDNQLAEAYTVMGTYYWAKGLTEQAIEAFDKALSYNPNDWQAYRGKGMLYWSDDDHVKSIENYQKAASLNHGPEFPELLRDLGRSYYTAGFIEKGNNNIVQAFKLDDDSAEYYSSLAMGYSLSGEYKKSNEYLEKGYTVDSTHHRTLLYFGTNYLFLGQFEESIRYLEKYVERLNELKIPDLHNMSEIGFVFLKNGYELEAEYYFNKQIEYGEQMIKLNRARIPYYDLAGVYAFRGERDKAYEILRLFNQKERMMSWAHVQINDDPLFDSIRDDPEFQEIVRDIQKKYQAEHERVRKWLEENDML
jgi:TolB-like protein/Tfp pilus assembly protein PilF